MGTLYNFKGIWRSDTNSPVLTDGVGTLDDIWLINNGTQGAAFIRNLGSGNTTWIQNQYALYNGTIWVCSLGYSSGGGSSISLTTLGNSGASTLVSTVLNVPNYTLSGLGGVPYVGATGNVNLGSYTGTANAWITNGGTLSQYISGTGALLTFPALTSGTVTSVATNSSLSGGPITTIGTLSINLGNTNNWTVQQNFNQGLSVANGYAVLFNGSSDTNWRQGIIGASAFTTSYVGNNTCIQVVTGTGGSGPDGYAIGATGGSSYFEIVGNTKAAYFMGALRIAGNTTMIGSANNIGTVTGGTLSTGAVIAGVTMTLGSDATGDIYYRSAGGILTRLGIGTTGQLLTVSGGLPAWQTSGTTTYSVTAGLTTSGGTNIFAIDPTYSNTWTIAQNIAVTSGSTVVPALTLKNTTAATSGNPQYPPYLYFTGNGYNTGGSVAYVGGGRIGFQALSAAFTSVNYLVDFTADGITYTNISTYNSHTAITTYGGAVSCGNLTSSSTATINTINISGAIGITTGTSKNANTATLVNGVVTVTNTRVTANSKFHIGYNPTSTPSITGVLSTQFQVTTITAGTSFVITALTAAGATNTTDQSVIAWDFYN